jgi:hypothetical protein
VNYAELRVVYLVISHCCEIMISTASARDSRLNHQAHVRARTARHRRRPPELGVARHPVTADYGGLKTTRNDSGALVLNSPYRL